MPRTKQLDSFESSFVFSLQKDEDNLSEEQERLKTLKGKIEYLLARYSTIKVNNVRVKDGLISPTEYLKSLSKIIEYKAPDTTFGKLLDEFVNNVSQLEKYLIVEGYLFRYGLHSRPLSIGTVPVGFICDSVKMHSKFRYGTIDYSVPLSEEQIKAFELIPLFLPKATIKWCVPEVKKALELGITLPTTEISSQQAISLVQQMKASQNKLHSSLQKHWDTMINRIINAFGVDFEQLL
jgi:hypothetical protein